MDHYSDLTPEEEQELEVLTFKYQIEEEDNRRKRYNRFGYSHGGFAAMLSLMVAMPFVSAIALFVQAFNGSGSIDSLTPTFWWSVTLPIMAIPFIPFIFLKLRSAISVFGITLAFFAVVVVLTGLGVLAMRMLF